MATGMVGVLDRPLGTFSIEEARVPDVAPGTVLLRRGRVISQLDILPRLSKTALAEALAPGNP